MYDGGLNLTDSWHEGFWGKIDAVVLLIARLYVLILIITVIISVVVTVLGVIVVSSARRR